MIFVLIVVLVWVICGFLAFGLTLAEFDGAFSTIAYYSPIERNRYLTVSTVMGLMGPIGLAVALVRGGIHRPKWKPPTIEESREAWKKDYGTSEVPF